MRELLRLPRTLDAWSDELLPYFTTPAAAASATERPKPPAPDQESERVGPDEDEVVTALGSRYLLKILGQHTGGALSLVEETPLGSDGPGLRAHENEEETFYVLDGRGVFVVGETEQDLRRGDLIVVPRGAPHTLAPWLADPLRMLDIVSPPVSSKSWPT